MPICLFSESYYPPSDAMIPVRIADHIHKLKKDYSEGIVIVVPDDNTYAHKKIHQKAIAQFYVDIINPALQVMSLSEFKSKNIPIECCIQVGHIQTLRWQEELREKIEGVPCIYMPNYGSYGSYVNSNSTAQKIFGGFCKEDKRFNVVLDEEFHTETVQNPLPYETRSKALEAIEDPLKSYLFREVSLESYSRSRNLCYQETENTYEYHTYEKDNQGKVIKVGGTYSATAFFLLEHEMFFGKTEQSQDIICTGCIGGADDKRNAFEKLWEDVNSNYQTHLKSNYSKVAFINIDTKQEKIYYQADLDKQDKSNYKEYCIYYISDVSLASREAIKYLSAFEGLSSDMRFIQMMSAEKLFTYECLSHNATLLASYLSALRQETQNQDVLRLATYLTKKADPKCHRFVEYNPDNMRTLLQNDAIVSELKNINRKLVSESKYFDILDKTLSEKVFQKDVKKTIQDDPEGLSNSSVYSSQLLSEQDEKEIPILLEKLKECTRIQSNLQIILRNEPNKRKFIKHISKDCQKWIEEINPLKQTLEKKLESNKHYTDVSDSVDKLLKALDKAKEQITINPTLANVTDLLDQYNKALLNLEVEAKNHRGWHNLPSYLRITIGILAVFTIIPPLLIGFKSYKYIFFETPHTNSTKASQKIRQNFGKDLQESFSEIFEKMPEIRMS